MLYRRTPGSRWIKNHSWCQLWTTCYDYNCSDAREESDLVAEEQDWGPDEEGSLAGVDHAVGDWADVVHQVVGCDGLTVEEYSI